MNTEKNFELTDEFKLNDFGVKLFRIKATKNFREIEKGTIGGWVEKIENVSGNAWVSDNANVSGDARVYGNANVSGNAWVYEDARVYGDADYCCFQSFGSSGRTTTVFREKENKLKVNCGCFSGTLEEFEKKVENTHGESQYAKEYKAIINVIKVKFGI